MYFSKPTSECGYKNSRTLLNTACPNVLLGTINVLLLIFGDFLNYGYKNPNGCLYETAKQMQSRNFQDTHGDIIYKILHRKSNTCMFNSKRFINHILNVNGVFGLSETSRAWGLLLVWQQKVFSARQYRNKLLRQPQDQLGDTTESSEQNISFNV